jgi:hypothetical protein
MKVLAVVLILIFVCGLGGSIFFWPSIRDERLSAFFSLLQFIAAFALILLTFLYVTTTKAILTATREQTADQNRAPRISVVAHWYPQTNPFVINFALEVANPSVRATSLRVHSVRIGEVLARSTYFEVNQRNEYQVTIPARDLVKVIVKADNFDPPVPITIGFKTKTFLLFEDIFHGMLPPVVTEL